MTSQAYREHIRVCLPIYTTRLVREAEVAYEDRDKISCPEDIAHVMSTYYSDRTAEEMFVVLLDTGNTVIGLHRASVGGLAASIVEPREVFRAALFSNAAAIILCHNHPSGNPEPSREDIRVTKQLVEAGKIMGIPVHDHVIIGDGGRYTSLAERGLI